MGKKIIYAVIIALALVALMIYYTGGNKVNVSSSIGRLKESIIQKQRSAAELENKKVDFFRAELKLVSENNQDILRVIPKADYTAGKNISFRYEWTINEEAAASATDSISGFKRGDKIAVKIIPYRDGQPGNPKMLTTEISNTPPKIMMGEKRDIDFSGNSFTYHVKAIDPDGDKLAYSLVEGPPGMRIDSTTGVIQWTTRQEDLGPFSTKIKISDGHGGEVIYPLNIDIKRSQDVSEK